jgi:hypothetical protein
MAIDPAIAAGEIVCGPRFRLARLSSSATPTRTSRQQTFWRFRRTSPDFIVGIGTPVPKARLVRIGTLRNAYLKLSDCYIKRSALGRWVIVATSRRARNENIEFGARDDLRIAIVAAVPPSFDHAQKPIA